MRKSESRSSLSKVGDCQIFRNLLECKTMEYRVKSFFFIDEFYDQIVFYITSNNSKSKKFAIQIFKRFRLFLVVNFKRKKLQN